MSNKNGFVIYRDWMGFFSSMQSEDVKATLIYLSDSASYINGELENEPIYNGSESSKPMAEFMKIQVEKNEIKYLERCNKNKDNINKRWKKENAGEANDFEKVKILTQYAIFNYPADRIDELKEYQFKYKEIINDPTLRSKYSSEELTSIVQAESYIKNQIELLYS